ncbi:MAG: hypothetical protein D4S01_02155 [Dehalococcoidia bacterium]|nr:MAG: hypothetical protein D4S01_02155 [Dehalococcoidia bacterium]
MATEKIEAFEYKHLECPQSWVDAILKQYSLFYWDLVATQIVVSKESHLEGGGLFDSDTIYSVTTTERFATIDLKRKRSIPNIKRIKDAERKYFQLCSNLIGLGCSPVDNYTPPSEKSIGCLGAGLYIFFVFPGILYSRKVKADNEIKLLEYQRLKTELDSLVTTNKQLLNI